MSRIGRAAGALLLAAGVASGCNTLDTRGNAGYDGPRTYSGTRASAGYIGSGLITLNIPIVFLFAVDLPFSMVADTLLLPITIPEERERQRTLAARARLDADVPGPVLPLPDAPHDENAERLFEHCVAYLERFDPRIVDCYAVGARIVEGPNTFTGAQYKPVLRENLSRLRGDGGYISYAEPQYRVQGGRVHIEATLASSFAEGRIPVSFVVAPGIDGYWRIVEETGPAWP